MNSLTSACILLIGLATVHLSDGLTCYACSGGVSSGCGGPFRPTTAQTITTTGNYACGVCATTRLADATGTLTYNRNCYADPTTIGLCDSAGCISTCKTDRCNSDNADGRVGGGAGQIQALSLVTVLAASATTLKLCLR